MVLNRDRSDDKKRAALQQELLDADRSDARIMAQALANVPESERANLGPHMALHELNNFLAQSGALGQALSHNDIPATGMGLSSPGAALPGYDGAYPAGVQMKEQAGAEKKKKKSDWVRQMAGRGVQGGGGALPHLDKLQQAFGDHDLSDVRAHIGGSAKDAGEAIGARAYAAGNDIAFNENPDLHTAAHEAAHVIQQRQGVHIDGGVGSVGDRYEQHADAVADAVVAGKSAASLLGQPGSQSVRADEVQRLVFEGDYDEDGQKLGPGTQELESTVNVAYDMAIRQMAAAAREMDQPAGRLYKTWFDQHHNDAMPACQARFRTVREKIYKLWREMDGARGSLRIRREVDDPATEYKTGYAYVEGDGIVRLGDLFVEGSAEDQAGTFIHELCHEFLNTPGEVQSDYGYVQALKWAWNDPDRALINSDTITFFAQQCFFQEESDDGAGGTLAPGTHHFMSDWGPIELTVESDRITVNGTYTVENSNWRVGIITGQLLGSRESGFIQIEWEQGTVRGTGRLEVQNGGKVLAGTWEQLEPRETSGIWTMIQAKENGRGRPQDEDVQRIASDGVSGSGGKLPHLDKIQGSFGKHDVSGVQAHTGGAAGDAAKQIGAKAYATGNDVAFGGSPDLHTAAHEAAHIVQQRAGVSLKGGVGQAGDKYEQHADAVADAVVQGKSAEGLLDTMAGSGKTEPATQRVVQKDEPETHTPGENVRAAGSAGEETDQKTEKTEASPHSKVAPSRTVTVPKVTQIGRIRDPVMRNHAINQSYHSIDSAMVQYTGDPLVSNWYTYGQHASREAGEQIKNLQAAIDTMKDALLILKNLTFSRNPWTIYNEAKRANRAVDRVIHLLEQPGMVPQAMQLAFAKAGIDSKRLKVLSDELDAAGTLDIWDLIPGKQAYEVIMAASSLVSMGIDLAAATPDIIAALFKIYRNMVKGNREIYENVAPAGAQFLAATNATSDGVVGTMSFAGDPNAFLSSAFALYSEVRKMSNELYGMDGTDPAYAPLVEKRKATAHKANLLVGYQEQLVILQPIFDTMQEELKAMGGTMVLRDPNGTHKLIPDWGDFYTRMGIDPTGAPENPAGLRGDGALPSLRDKNDKKSKGTIAEYFEEGLTDKKIHEAPEKIRPQRKESGPNAPTGDWVQAVAAKGVEGSGGALPHLDKIQGSFGKHDVSGVQAHTGGAAGSAAKQIGAKAYATGNDVAFGGSPDLHTAAHEAAHIVQQRAGVSLKGGVGQAGDKYEQHADAVADLVVQGKSAEGLLDSMAGSGKSEAVQSKAVQMEEEKAGEKKEEKAKPTLPPPNLYASVGAMFTDLRLREMVDAKNQKKEIVQLYTAIYRRMKGDAHSNLIGAITAVDSAKRALDLLTIASSGEELRMRTKNLNELIGFRNSVQVDLVNTLPRFSIERGTTPDVFARNASKTLYTDVYNKAYNKLILTKELDRLQDYKATAGKFGRGQEAIIEETLQEVRGVLLTIAQMIAQKVLERLGVPEPMADLVTNLALDLLDEAVGNQLILKGQIDMEELSDALSTKFLEHIRSVLVGSMKGKFKGGARKMLKGKLTNDLAGKIATFYVVDFKIGVPLELLDLLSKEMLATKDFNTAVDNVFNMATLRAYWNKFLMGKAADKLEGANFKSIQKKESTPNAPTGDWVQAVAADGVKGSGGKLPHLDKIQGSFGKHDVSGVQAHTGGAAGDAAKQIGAKAYATGNDVAFGGSPDLHTAAHEAAHIVQQRAGVSLKGGVGQAGDKYEQHADAVADLVVQGKSAEGLLDSMAGSGKSESATQRVVQREPDPEPGRAHGEDTSPSGKLKYSYKWKFVKGKYGEVSAGITMATTSGTEVKEQEQGLDGWENTSSDPKHESEAGRGRENDAKEGWKPSEPAIKAQFKSGWSFDFVNGTWKVAGEDPAQGWYLTGRLFLEGPALDIATKMKEGTWVEGNASVQLGALKLRGGGLYQDPQSNVKAEVYLEGAYKITLEQLTELATSKMAERAVARKLTKETAEKALRESTEKLIKAGAKRELAEASADVAKWRVQKVLAKTTLEKHYQQKWLMEALKREANAAEALETIMGPAGKKAAKEAAEEATEKVLKSGGKVVASELAEKAAQKAVGKVAAKAVLKGVLHLVPFVNVAMVIWDVYDIATMAMEIHDAMQQGNSGGGGGGEGGENSAGSAAGGETTSETENAGEATSGAELDAEKIPGAEEGPPPIGEGILTIAVKPGKGYAWFAQKMTAEMQAKGHNEFHIDASTLSIRMQGQMLHPISYVFVVEEILKGGVLIVSGSQEQEIRAIVAGAKWRVENGQTYSGADGGEEGADYNTWARYAGKTIIWTDRGNSRRVKLIEYRGQTPLGAQFLAYIHNTRENNYFYLRNPGEGETGNIKLARKESTPNAPTGDWVQAVAADGVKGSGGALPYMDKIQASFGSHDVSGVQAHTGGAAGDAAKQIGAKAYATGNDVAFGGSPDLHTAAHEAAHIVQQRAGVSLKGGVGEAGDKYEQHADAVADLVVQGKSAEGLLDSMAGSGKSEPATQRVVQKDGNDEGKEEADNFNSHAQMWKIHREMKEKRRNSEKEAADKKEQAAGFNERQNPDYLHIVYANNKNPELDSSLTGIDPKPSEEVAWALEMARECWSILHEMPPMSWEFIQIREDIESELRAQSWESSEDRKKEHQEKIDKLRSELAREVKDARNDAITRMLNDSPGNILTLRQVFQREYGMDLKTLTPLKSRVRDLKDSKQNEGVEKYYAAVENKEKVKKFYGPKMVRFLSKYKKDSHNILPPEAFDSQFTFFQYTSAWLHQLNERRKKGTKIELYEIDFILAMQDLLRNKDELVLAQAGESTVKVLDEFSPVLQELMIVPEVAKDVEAHKKFEDQFTKKYGKEIATQVKSEPYLSYLVVDDISLDLKLSIPEAILKVLPSKYRANSHFTVSWLLSKIEMYANQKWNPMNFFKGRTLISETNEADIYVHEPKIRMQHIRAFIKMNQSNYYGTDRQGNKMTVADKFRNNGQFAQQLLYYENLCRNLQMMTDIISIIPGPSKKGFGYKTPGMVKDLNNVSGGIDDGLKYLGGGGLSDTGRYDSITDGAVQKKESTPNAPTGDWVQMAAAEGLKGSATSLPHGDWIQSCFGKHDISGVEAHTDSAAGKAAGDIGAKAYASGNKVAFKGTPDLHTSAHEAAHVVQQRGGVQLKSGVGQAGDKHEQHADAVADLVVQGKSAEGLLDQYAHGGRSHAVQLKEDAENKYALNEARGYASQLLKAFQGMGTTEDAVYGALNQSPSMVRLIQQEYNRGYNKHTGNGLIKDLKYEMSGEDLDFAIAQLRRAGVYSLHTVRYINQTEDGQYNASHRIAAYPNKAVVVPGTPVTLEVKKGPEMYAQGSYYTYQWYRLNDPTTAAIHNESNRVEGPSRYKWTDAQASIPGNHKYICRVQFHPSNDSPHDPEFIEYRQSVMSHEWAAQKSLNETETPGDPGERLQGVQDYLALLKEAEKQAGSGKLDPETKEQLEEYIAKLKERLASTDGVQRIPVKAAHVDTEGGTVTPLNVFVAKVGGTTGQQTWKVVDITNPADRRLTGEYEGTGENASSAIKAAIKEWDADNRYPDGLIRVQVPKAAAGYTLSRDFQTDGMSFWDSIGSFFDTVGIIAGVGAIAAGIITALLPVPGSRVVSAAIWTSIAASTVGAGISLATRHDEGFGNARDDAFDVLTIAGNMVLGAGLWVRGASVAMNGTKGATFVKGCIIGELTTDGFQGILLAEQYVGDYDKIMKIKDPQKRMDALLSLLGSAAATTGMMTLSMAGNRSDLKSLKGNPHLNKLTDPKARINIDEIAGAAGGPVPKAAIDGVEGAVVKPTAGAAGGPVPDGAASPRIKSEADEVATRTARSDDATARMTKIRETASGASYDARGKTMLESNGKITSEEAFTDAAGEWVPSRRTLHDKLISDAVEDARAFAKAMEGEDAALYAMRGNTAAGKTRTIKSGHIPELEGAVKSTDSLRHRAINPDNFKLDLMEADAAKFGSTPTHSQVHAESSHLASRLQKELFNLKGADGTPASVLVDQRLGKTKNIDDLAEVAQRTGRKLNVYDVDADLEASLAGVLGRKPGGADPIPPFEVVAEGGFGPARGNRMEVIQRFVDNPELGKYELYATKANGDKVPVAKVEGGNLQVMDDNLFKKLTADPKVEIAALADTKIDDALIKRITDPLPEGGWKQSVIDDLTKNKGLTWRQAINKHGGN